MQIDFSTLDKADMSDLIITLTKQLIKYEKNIYNTSEITINDVYRRLKTETSLINCYGNKPEYVYYIFDMGQPVYDKKKAFELYKANKENNLFRSYYLGGKHYMEFYDEDDDAWKFEINGEIYHV